MSSTATTAAKKLKGELTFTTVKPCGAYWNGFLESTFMAMWSFQPNSSAFCQGVSVLGSKNLMNVPDMKDCHTGVGQLWDQCLGESKGDEGAGDELSPACIELTACADRSLKSTRKEG